MKNLLEALLFKTICLSILLLVACQPTGEVFTEAICITNISTIDPTEGLKGNQTVIIKEGKIHKIASSKELKLAKNNNIIDGTGKFLIPGLWDAHVHFAYIEELAPSMFDLFLAYGITSVRDTGGKLEFVKKWKNKSLADPSKAPRVMIAGPLLDGMPNVYDGSDAMHPPLSVGMQSVEDLEQQIHELAEQGVDLLKAYEMLTPEQFATISRLGKEKGLKVTGHVPLSMDVISASNVGLNSMEHLRNMELSCASNSDELLAERRQLLADGAGDAGGILRTRIHTAQREKAIQNYDEKKADEILNVLAKNQTWQIPTLALSTGYVNRPFAQPQFQESFAYLPDTLEKRWKAEIEAFTKIEITPFREQYNTWFFNMVGKVHKADIDIMAGTDCPIFFLTPGRSLHEELEVLVKAGLSPLDALKTATLNPARYFNLEKELGSIQENMWADLLILDANPLDDIKNTQQIHAVFREGTLYDREGLDEILERLAVE